VESGPHLCGTQAVYQWSIQVKTKEAGIYPVECGSRKDDWLVKLIENFAL